MRSNLDTIRSEAESYIQQNGFLLYYSFARSEQSPTVRWDTEHYPDFRGFLGIARELGVKLVTLHHHQLSATVIDAALEDMLASGFEFEEQRGLEKRLRELSAYDGFTCAVELAFIHEGTLYLFEVRAEWFDELNDLLDQVDMLQEDQEEEGGSPLGGYYSQN